MELTSRSIDSWGGRGLVGGRAGGALRSLGFAAVVLYLWVMMILFGSIVMETFMLYPNIFHDPPASLEFGMQFMSVRGPSTYFPPLGLLSWITATAALVLGWHVRPARYWIMLSLAMIVGEGVVSMLYFWPRNEIMFIEGTAVHSAEFIRQTAREFQQLHWSRLAFNTVSAAAIFVGCLRYYGWQVISTAGRKGDVTA